MTRAADVGLPPRPFFYTLDQIATLVSIDLETLRTSHVWYEGRSGGIHRKDLLRAVNFAPIGERPDWRVIEAELVRWLRMKRIRIYERARYTTP